MSNQTAGEGNVSIGIDVAVFSAAIESAGDATPGTVSHLVVSLYFYPIFQVGNTIVLVVLVVRFIVLRSSIVVTGIFNGNHRLVHVGKVGEGVGLARLALTSAIDVAVVLAGILEGFLVIGVVGIVCHPIITDLDIGNQLFALFDPRAEEVLAADADTATCDVDF